MNGILRDTETFGLLLPFVPVDDNNQIIPQQIPAGLFVDRIYVKVIATGDDGFDKMRSIVEGAVDHILTKAVTANDKKTESSRRRIKENILELKEYFKTPFVMIEADSDKVIEELNSALDTVELHNRCCNKDLGKGLVDLLDVLNKTCFYERTGLKNGDENYSFPDLKHVAVPKNFEPNINKEDRLSDNYVAYVQSDGDNFGKFVQAYQGTLEDPNGVLNRFSRALFKFGGEAVKLLQEKLATPIYAGGDDLLFWAPVNIRRGKGEDTVSLTVFEIIKEVDDLFNEIMVEFKEFKCDGKQYILSMSYGVSITPVKYPLSEARKAALGQLLEKAKEQKDHRGEIIKNAVACRLLKSGASVLDFSFSKDSAVFTDEKYGFNKILSHYLDDPNILASVSYKMNRFKPIIAEVLAEVPINSVRVKAFFDNYFENTSNNKVFLNAVKEFLLLSLRDQGVYVVPNEMEAVEAENDEGIITSNGDRTVAVQHSITSQLAQEAMAQQRVEAVAEQSSDDRSDRLKKATVAIDQTIQILHFMRFFNTKPQHND